ncbi:hypothetical protein [Amycolatopsis sp. CA-128772]|uniref:hypothetical protein n=1 Tax=Amycolatopsis sp. CA-128772 TaxID=2073159 RepID=UPI000CCFF57D|nr:hypothetical protein [Amycolatopsis sp. CA-128772]
MTYSTADIRSRLPATAPAAAPGTGPAAQAQFIDFTATEPDEVTERGSRIWWVRGQNFAVSYAVACAGEVLEREAQPDEYVALFPGGPVGADIRSEHGSASVEQPALVVVPPGASRIELTRDTQVIRLFSAASAELLARCRNNDAYREPDPYVSGFAPWPPAVDGPHLRIYFVADHPYAPGRFGRLFRCSTFMVNLFDPDLGPRDPAALSPHHHDDFEQCSLTVEGHWCHHIRTPWTTNLADWRPDEHVAVASPSVTIIPPPLVHTSQSTGQARNQLIDVFCPPRHDFSAQPGWVVNAHEYPVPEAENAR